MEAKQETFVGYSSDHGVCPRGIEPPALSLNKLKFGFAVCFLRVGSSANCADCPEVF